MQRLSTIFPATKERGDLKATVTKRKRGNRGKGDDAAVADIAATGADVVRCGWAFVYTGRR